MLNRGYEGRTVVTDNFFTSHDLGKSLLTHKMGLVGTVRANKRFVPPALRDTSDRKVMSSKFAHCAQGTMVSYLPKRGKNVLLYSTIHHDQSINSSTTKMKPSIVDFYNKNKGAVDTVDRRIASYSVRRATRNWKTAVFCNGIDLSLNNAAIIYDSVFQGWSKAKDRKRIFLQNLGTALVTPHIQRRERVPRGSFAAQIVESVKSAGTKRKATGSSVVTPPVPKRTKATQATKRTASPKLDNASPAPKRAKPTSAKKRQGEAKSPRFRCRFCKGPNKHSNKCDKCSTIICKRHATTVCPDCNKE